MYNLNVNVASAAAMATANLLSAESATNCSTTPKTPEILNSLIAMTNPFEGVTAQSRLAALTPGSMSPGGGGAGSGSSPPLSLSQSQAQSQSQAPPSVQHTCSQLIKEGLKLTIQTKRRQTGQPLDILATGPPPKLARRDELTPEDEERRRRRRERNKIAATKCRLKKRERTHNLVQESEVLETQNHELKSQIQELESQRRRLVDMLSMHTPTCLRNIGGQQYSQLGAPGYAQAQSPTSTATTAYESHCGYILGYAASPVDHGCMA